MLPRSEDPGRCPRCGLEQARLGDDPPPVQCQEYYIIGWEEQLKEEEYNGSVYRDALQCPPTGEERPDHGLAHVGDEATNCSTAASPAMPRHVACSG
jgi:hypothetical protein